MNYSKLSHRLMRLKPLPFAIQKRKVKWWKDDKVYKQVKEYHDAKAREPPGLKEARRHLNEVVQHIHQHFHGNQEIEDEDGKKKKKIAKRFEYTGSTYEGLKIPSEETLEFDIMVILDKGVFLKINSLKKRPAHVTLSPRWRHRGRFRQVLHKKLVSPEKATGEFFRQVQLCFNDWEEKRGGEDNTVIKPVKNGPATKLQVYKGDEVWYYVDLVPAYEVFVKKTHNTDNGEVTVEDESQIYVAKPYKGPRRTPMDDFTWRRSFSLKEKYLLVNIDKDNGCRKQCIRVLKAVREKESVLAKVLCSYHIKTTVLSLCRKNPNLPWKNKDLPARLRDIMTSLATDLDNWRMEHYYLSNYNLLFGTNRKACKNAAKRLQKLTKKATFLQVFNKEFSPKPANQQKNHKKTKNRNKKMGKLPKNRKEVPPGAKPFQVKPRTNRDSKKGDSKKILEASLHHSSVEYFAELDIFEKDDFGGYLFELDDPNDVYDDFCDLDDPYDFYDNFYDFDDI